MRPSSPLAGGRCNDGPAGKSRPLYLADGGARSDAKPVSLLFKRYAKPSSIV